jgi:putative MATE family efflux protein
MMTSGSLLDCCGAEERPGTEALGPGPSEGRRRPDRVFLRSLMALALPIAFQQLMLAISSSMDALMLTGVGQDALSGVSLAVQVQFVFNILIGSLTLGMSVLAAQYWGAGDREAVESVLSLVMRYAIAVSLVFTVLTAAVPVQVMSVFTNQPDLIELGARYLRVTSPSFLLTGISQIYLCLMKNTGAASRGTIISTAGVLVHLVLNGALIFGPGPLPALGVAGAAIALVASRCLEFAWSFAHSCRGGNPRVHTDELLRSDPLLVRRFWRYSLPVLGDMIAWGAGFTMYTVVMGHLGSDAVAANSIANIVKDLLVCLCLGLGNGGGILIGAMLGRGDTAGAREAGRWLVRLAIAAGGATGLVILAIRPLVVHGFALTPQADRYLSVMLIICSYYVVGKAINATTISGIFVAGGDTRFGFLCDVVTMWVVVIPLGLLAAFAWDWPVLWVYALLNTDEILKLPAVFWRFRTYRWVRTLTGGSGTVARNDPSTGTPPGESTR